MKCQSSSLKLPLGGQLLEVSFHNETSLGPILNYPWALPITFNECTKDWIPGARLVIALTVMSLYEKLRCRKLLALLEIMASANIAQSKLGIIFVVIIGNVPSSRDWDAHQIGFDIF
jgi:hypothetical protein